MVINRARRLARKFSLGANVFDCGAEALDVIDAAGRLLAQEKHEATRRPCDHGEAQCAGEAGTIHGCEDLAF